jgi:hypothetical protein
VPALLGTRLLVLDVVARHADLDEPPDQVANVGVTAVPGVGVSDDEWPEVDGRAGCALLLGHPAAEELLIAVRREQRADEPSRFVGHLAQRVAREVRAWVFRRRALGRRRPAAKVDPLDAEPLHHDGLTRRIRPERRDLPAAVEQLPESRVEILRGSARDGVILRDRALLFSDLASGMQPDDAFEARRVEPVAQSRDAAIEAVGSGSGLAHGHSSRRSGSIERLLVRVVQFAEVGAHAFDVMRHDGTASRCAPGNHDVTALECDQLEAVAGGIVHTKDPRARGHGCISKVDRDTGRNGRGAHGGLLGWRCG